MASLCLDQEIPKDFCYIEVEEEDEFAEGVRKEEKVFSVSPEDERQGLLNKAGREQEMETDLRFSLRKRKSVKRRVRKGKRSNVGSRRVNG